jgi:hypothetical protein
LRRMGRKTGPQWTVSRRFSELDAAHDWGIMPHVWDSAPEESRAEALAFYQVKSQMASYDEWLAERKRESTPPARGRRR